MSHSIMCYIGDKHMHELLNSVVLELRRGVLILGVLSQLHEKEYGYVLLVKLKESHFEIEAGTLYPLLRRLEKQGLLESSWQLIDNRPRRYYQMSAQGQMFYMKLKEEYSSLHETISKLTQGDAI